MIQFTGVSENGKNVQYVQRAKLVFSSSPQNKGGSELIPLEIGGHLVPNTSSSVNELGKHLLKASANGDVDEIKKLLSKGAPFAADWLGTSPLHLAAQNNHLEIAEILLRGGISKDARTKVDRTPLHMAAYEGHIQVVETLIKHAADIDCRDLLGMTPLHWAVQNGHLNVVECLLKNGADINACNKFDLTPALIARQINRIDIENALENELVSDIATQNLVIQLANEDALQNGNDTHGLDEEMEESNGQSIIIPLEPEMISQYQNQDNAEVEIIHDDPDNQFEESELLEKQSEQLVQNTNIDATNLSDSLKLLQEHGITMLQNDSDETNILNTVMESGHSVVLTDVGKEVLNSVKESEQEQAQQRFTKERKIMTVTPEEFLAVANNAVNNAMSKPVKIRRVVMKKSKLTPITVCPQQVNNEERQISLTNPSRTDMEQVMTQLIEARKTIEEMKVKLLKKEEEAERYKMQLKLLMDPS